MTQREIYNNVQARGYVQGDMDANQYAAKQLMKLLEEIAELTDKLIVKLPDVTRDVRAQIIHAQMVDVGQSARLLFDAADWANADVQWLDGVPGEIADAQVVLCMLAETLGVDAMGAALAKSAGDVERGKR